MYQKSDLSQITIKTSNLINSLISGEKNSLTVFVDVVSLLSSNDIYDEILLTSIFFAVIYIIGIDKAWQQEKVWSVETEV